MSEIICSCGHELSLHGLAGCKHTTVVKKIGREPSTTVCVCQKTSEKVLSEELAALRSLLGDAMKALELLIKYDELPVSGSIDPLAHLEFTINQTRGVHARIKATLTGGE